RSVSAYDRVSVSHHRSVNASVNVSRRVSVSLDTSRRVSVSHHHSVSASVDVSRRVSVSLDTSRRVSVSRVGLTHTEMGRLTGVRTAGELRCGAGGGRRSGGGLPGGWRVSPGG